MIPESKSYLRPWDCAQSTKLFSSSFFFFFVLIASLLVFAFFFSVHFYFFLVVFFVFILFLFYFCIASYIALLLLPTPMFSPLLLFLGYSSHYTSFNSFSFSTFSFGSSFYSSFSHSLTLLCLVVYFYFFFSIPPSLPSPPSIKLCLAKKWHTAKSEEWDVKEQVWGKARIMSFWWLSVAHGHTDHQQPAPTVWPQRPHPVTTRDLSPWPVWAPKLYINRSLNWTLNMNWCC